MKAFSSLFVVIAVSIFGVANAQKGINEDPVSVSMSLPGSKMFYAAGVIGKFNLTEAAIIEVFDVKRIKTKVDILWETDINTSTTGYEIQRRSGNQEWQRVAFVYPQTEVVDGSKKLVYEYNDVNTVKEETQYRLLQFNNKHFSSSEVKTIAGIEL